MSKTFLAGWRLGGRSGLRPFLYHIPLPYRLIPKILRYRVGQEIRIDGWRFNLDYGIVYLRERDTWRDYLPPGGLKGKIVLDVGAGCGETAKYFLENGARAVYAVENNEEALTYLRLNAEGRPIHVEAEAFDPFKHILGQIDLVKLDIEGYEISLLTWLEAYPKANLNIVLEAHNVWMRDRFQALGFTQIRPPWITKDSQGGFPTCIMYRWKK